MAGPPNSTYNIDDSPPITYSPITTPEDLHQQLFYQSPLLRDGEHRLVVTYMGNNGGLLIDYFLYLPSSAPPPPATPAVLVLRESNNPLTLHSDGVVVVDDSDASSVLYQGAWQVGGITTEYLSTTHGTFTVGSTATLNFTGMDPQLRFNNRGFNLNSSGTSLAVYGSIWRGTIPVSTYTIDNSISDVYTATLSDSPLFQILFYQSPILQDGPRTLVVNFTSGYEFWLDYFLYIPSASSHHSSSVPLGAIIGGVIAGVTSIMVCLVVYFKCYSRTPKKTHSEDPPPQKEASINLSISGPQAPPG